MTTLVFAPLEEARDKWSDPAGCDRRKRSDGGEVSLPWECRPTEAIGNKISEKKHKK
ncbi:MAG: hypothetical protein F6K24_31740 [Okeania sp. SIO2D1]|nr:hypothetical protein [Okeania sp. SIO2D1]